MADKKKTAVEVCADIAPDDKNSQAQCQNLISGILSARDEKLIEANLKRLGKVTGKTSDEIVEKIYKHCPVCGGIGEHEH